MLELRRNSSYGDSTVLQIVTGFLISDYGAVDVEIIFYLGFLVSPLFLLSVICNIVSQFFKNVGR